MSKPSECAASTTVPTGDLCPEFATEPRTITIGAAWAHVGVSVAAVGGWARGDHTRVGLAEGFLGIWLAPLR